MEINNWFWFLLRLLIIAYFFYGGFGMYSPEVSEFDESFDKNNFPLMSAFPILFFPLFVVFSSWRDYKKHPNKKLAKPNWFKSFINFKESYHFFEVGGYSFIAAGTGLLISSAMSNNQLIYSPIFFISAGIGCLIGVYVSAYLYTKEIN